MINKDRIFASQGQTAGSSMTGYTTGMIPNTVAKAEDVNLYLGSSDEQLYVVCQELLALLTSRGISADANDNTQLLKMFNEKFQTNFALTGIDRNSFTTAPTQNNNTITFPSMKIVYNTGTYYGNTDKQHQVTTLAAQTLSANNTWPDGVHYIYSQTTAGSSSSTLGHTQSAFGNSMSATVCLLGTVYVYNGAFQAGTWKFQPWLQITSAENRENPNAMTRGGYVKPASATTLQMGNLEIMAEGINFGANVNKPNIVDISGVSPYTYKLLHPLYNPGSSALSALDTTHVFNTTNRTWDDISSMASDTNPHYIVLVPCITPAGQTLMIAAMSPKVSGNYTQVFDSMEAASNAVFSLTYDLLNANGRSVAERVIYLGQSLIVKVGATNLQDPTQFATIGMLPQALTGFSSVTGQSSGSVVAYTPMPSVVWSGYSTLTCQNNAVNVIVDTNSTINVSMPTPTANILNQLEIHYSCTGGSINWGTTITWWAGTAPSFSSGTTYNIVLEYENGHWYGGVLGLY